MLARHRRYVVVGLATVAIALLAVWQKQPTTGDLSSSTERANAPSAHDVGAALIATPDVQSARSAPTAAPPPFTVRPIAKAAIPDRPLAAFLDEYRQAAAAADADAAHVLSRALRLCQNVPEDEAGRAAQVARLERESLEAGRAPEAIAALVGNLESRHAFCAGVASDDVAQWYAFLERATELGGLAAQVEFLRTIPPWESEIRDGRPTPEQLERIRQSRTPLMGYYESARDQGSVEALIGLGTQLYKGMLVERDLVAAYGHLRAAQRVYVSLGRPSGAGALLDRIRVRLRPNELEVAEALAERLLANPNCCRL